MTEPFLCETGHRVTQISLMRWSLNPPMPATVRDIALLSPDRRWFWLGCAEREGLV